MPYRDVEFEYKFLFLYSDGVAVRMSADGTSRIIPRENPFIKECYDLIPLDEAKIQMALGLIPTMKYTGWGDVAAKLVRVYKLRE